MPSLNIYTNKERAKSLKEYLPKLREFIAKELSCRDRKIDSNEVSLRIIVPNGSLLIADTELEIKAHKYPERVQKQDEICLSIKDFVQRICPKAGLTYVWLQLSELGHSTKA